MQNKVFPLGTHIYREPCFNLEQTLKDLTLLKQYGFTMIKIQEVWAADERKPNVYDFSAICRLIEKADELGLGVYLGLTMEEAPAWFWKKHPDASPKKPDGSAWNDPTQYCLPGDGKPGPCWHHPRARKTAERFMKAIAQILGKYRNIYVWNVWQEIAFGNDALGLCYCEHTLAAFQKWLKDRFKTLKELNACWHTFYSDWNSIQPPRQFAAVPALMDFRYFMDDVYLPEVIAWKSKILKDNDPCHRPVFSHICLPVIGRGAEWQWARTSDFFGDSNYPGWGVVAEWEDAEIDRSDKSVTLSHEMWHYFQLNTDYTRSAAAGKKIWGAEFQGGPTMNGPLHPGRIPNAMDIRRWILCALAAGMQGISFWNHRAERFWAEGSGFGLLDQTGDSTERIQSVCAIGAALNKQGDFFAQSSIEQPEAAIFINEDLWHFCQASGSNAEEHLAFTIRGLYGRLWHQGIWVDFIDQEQVKHGCLSRYKMVMLPMPFAMDADLFSYFKDYTANGGFLVSEAAPGRFSRYGICTSGLMLPDAEKVFGCIHSDMRIVREPDGTKQAWSVQEKAWAQFADACILNGADAFTGVPLRASWQLQTLLPQTGSPVFFTPSGACAGVLNAYGKGKALLIGTCIGHSFLVHRIPGNDLFTEKLADIAGLTKNQMNGLFLRKRILEKKEAWFLMNPTDSSIQTAIELNGYKILDAIPDDIVLGSTASQIKICIPEFNCGIVLVSLE